MGAAEGGDQRGQRQPEHEPEVDFVVHAKWERLSVGSVGSEVFESHWKHPLTHT